MRRYIKYIGKNIRKGRNELFLRKKFDREFEAYNKMAGPAGGAPREYLYPCLYDATTLTEIEPVYFYQDAWAFERILATRPAQHVDIGSSFKLVSFLSKITDLTMIDIRPLSLEMASIKFRKGDILNLPFADGAVGSLSSICVIEHIGLGRYGDSLDPEGTEKAIREIDRVLAPGADFYFSVPVEEVGKTYFNAHRSFNERHLLETLLGNYQLVDKKYIYGQTFGERMHPEQFGTGCYHLKKK